MSDALAARPADATRVIADRRLYRRYEVGLPAALAHGSGALTGALADISLGGGGFRPAAAELTGAHVRLEIAAAGLSLPARVVAASGDVCHLAFELDPEEEEALALFLLATA